MNVLLRNLLGFVVLNFVFTLSFAQTPRIMWWYDMQDIAFGQAAIADIDGSGKNVIVFGCYRNDSSIYALNANDGSLLWKHNAASYPLEGCNDVPSLFYDVDGDGIMEVIVPSSCKPVTYCFNAEDGSIKWETPTRGSDSPPVIVDIDHDGTLEIIHGQFGGWVICLDAKTGAEKWEILVDPNSWVQTAPTILDVDDDGKLDFVVATWGFDNNSKLYAYDGTSRSLKWSVPMNDVVYHGTAVADLDDDGKPELVVGDYNGTLHVLNAENGSLLWNYQADYYIPSPVVIGDITGDKNCEIIFSSFYKIIALRKNGSLLWEYEIPDYGQCFRGVVLADITNDDLPEVIFGSSNGSVYALDGTNGKMLWAIDLQAHYGDTFSIDFAPIIADFNGNDTLDLFVAGGHSRYPLFNQSYGRAYAITLGKGNGPAWKMFQRDYYRTSSTCYPYNILSVKDENEVDDFTVYPVPVSRDGRLTIEKNIQSPYFVRITDLTGRCHYEGYNVVNIDLLPLNLNSGFYILQITGNNNTQIKSFLVYSEK